jgi:hypothetical protein
MSDDLAAERERVALAQERLMRTLVLGAAAPPGFDATRLEVQAAALRAKRGRSVARAAPDLVVALGAAWDDEFVRYARENPIPTARGSSDPAAFRRWLRTRRQRRGRSSQSV